MRIEHDIIIDINANCFSFTATADAGVHENAGKQLTIYKKKEEQSLGRGRMYSDAGARGSGMK
ncbi:MAG: hypothetical protein ABIX01_18535 [Chitinophagaceae bacterium]